MRKLWIALMARAVVVLGVTASVAWAANNYELTN